MGLCVWDSQDPIPSYKPRTSNPPTATVRKDTDTPVTMDDTRRATLSPIEEEDYEFPDSRDTVTEESSTAAAAKGATSARVTGSSSAVSDHELSSADNSSGPPVTVSVPVVSAFIPRTPEKTQGKFDDDRGLFALSSLLQGTRILNEEPLIIFLNGDRGDYRVILEQFWKLTSEQQASIELLKPAAIAVLYDLARKVDDFVKPIMELAAKTQAERTDEERNTWEKLTPLAVYLASVWRIAARFNTYAMPLTNIDESKLDRYPSDLPTEGYFHFTCQMRHSCVPNCISIWNPIAQQMTTHAIRDIAPHEELTISLLRRNYYDTVALRTEALKKFPNWFCGCEACDTKHANFLKHENTRQELSNRVFYVERFLNLINRYDSLPNIIGPKQLPPPSQQDFEDIERCVLSILRLLRDAGCETIELIEWRRLLINRVFNRMNPPKLLAAVAHAAIMERIALRFLGADNPRMPDFAMFLKDAKARADEMKEKNKVTAEGTIEEESKEMEEEKLEETSEEKPEERPVSYKGKGKAKVED